MNEIWKPVKGYEGLYEVSNEGRVRSLDRVITSLPCSYRVAQTRRFRGKLKATRLNNYGYELVTLSANKKAKTFSLHRLVLEAFVGECPDGMEACHYDDNPTNNHLSNLRWDTHYNNCQERDSPKGQANGNSILTDNQVREIKWALSHSFSNKEIANTYGVGRANINRIANNHSWSHINAF